MVATYQESIKKKKKQIKGTHLIKNFIFLQVILDFFSNNTNNKIKYSIYEKIKIKKKFLIIFFFFFIVDKIIYSIIYVKYIQNINK